MKYYIAGSFKDRHRIQEYMTYLELEGHEITVDWTKYDDSNLAQSAFDDIEGIYFCDIFLAIVDGTHSYGGTRTELGAALLGCHIGCCDEVHIIGHALDDDIFIHHTAITRFDTWADYERYLKNEDSTA